MLRRWIGILGFLTVLAINVAAQRTFPVSPKSFDFCDTHARDMYCFLPTFGLQGTGLTAQGNVESNINTLAGIELSLLPMPSPASGITFSFLPQLGAVSRRADSLGPIMSERADTLGRHQFFLGFAYQHFGFDSFEGKSLHSITGLFVRSIDELSVDEFTFFVGMGLTKRIDVSAAIPIRNINETVSGEGFGLVLTPDPSGGFIPSFQLQNMTSHRQRSGLSDITLRAKAAVWKRERGGVALGVDVRTPTGKPLEFMGAGAVGVKPFAAASFSRKIKKMYIAPHINAGYEFNGSSILGGTLLGESGRLPRRFVYAFGTELGVLPRTTLTLDFDGEKLFSAKRSYFFSPSFQPTSVTVTYHNVNIEEASIGGKVNVTHNLVVTGNLAFKVNNGGLRARLIPLIGASYTF